jgi:hypothetical protein
LLPAVVSGENWSLVGTSAVPSEAVAGVGAYSIRTVFRLLLRKTSLCSSTGLLVRWSTGNVSRIVGVSLMELVHPVLPGLSSSTVPDGVSVTTASVVKAGFVMLSGHISLAGVVEVTLGTSPDVVVTTDGVVEPGATVLVDNAVVGADGVVDTIELKQANIRNSVLKLSLLSTVSMSVTRM